MNCFRNVWKVTSLMRSVYQVKMGAERSILNTKDCVCVRTCLTIRSYHLIERQYPLI
jgi:hypothetical protein